MRTIISAAAAFMASSTAASAQVVDVGEKQPIGIPPSAVVIPQSSAAKPAGYRHTNTRFIPAATIRTLSAQAGRNDASPLVGPPFSGYGFETPGSLSCLYGLVAATAGCNPNTAKTVASTRGSKAVAIVDAYHYASALADLTKFSTQFGLPAPKLSVKYATAAGGCNGPRPPSDLGWAIEEALDIQMAHAMAPKATIYLVEAQSNSDTDLIGAVKCANALLKRIGGGEMSLSWGGGETSAYESAFLTNDHIVYFASSGDAPGVSWPSSSPNVVSVGGTSLSRSPSTFAFLHHASWADAGEGPSAIFARPSYQQGVAGIAGTKRVTPDIAAVANPSTGAWVWFDDPNFSASDRGWYVVGGTSLASPVVAGVTNSRATFRLSSAAELTALYAAKASTPAVFATTTIGYCGPYAAYVPNSKWNYCLGLGTLNSAGTTPLLAEAQ